MSLEFCASLRPTEKATSSIARKRFFMRAILTKQTGDSIQFLDQAPLKVRPEAIEFLLVWQVDWAYLDWRIAADNCSHLGPGCGVDGVSGLDDKDDPRERVEVE